MTPLHLSRNHFELFGLPARFAIDLGQRELGYRNIQSRVHPDRFANGTGAERRASMQCATRVNEACQTLRIPLRRARPWLPNLRGFLHRRQPGERHREFRFVVFLILQIAGEILDVGLHVEVAVAA